MTAGADQKNQIIKIRFSKKAKRVRVNQNKAHGKDSKQVNLIS